MNGLKDSHVLPSIAFLITAAVFAKIASGFPVKSDSAIQPAQFPLFLSGLLALLVILQLIKHEPRKSERQKEQVSPIQTALALIAYLCLMPILGFILTTAIFISVFLLLFGWKSKVTALAIGFVFAYALYALFGVIMNVSLPEGWVA